MQYEKPQLNIVMFELEDVITSSSVVHTTAAPTTLPGSTSSNVGVGQGSQGDIVVDLGDYFK